MADERPDPHPAGIIRLLRALFPKRKPTAKREPRHLPPHGTPRIVNRDPQYIQTRTR